MPKNLFKRLGEFLPLDKRKKILNELLDIYGMNELAIMLDSKESKIKAWLKRGPSTKLMPKILWLSFSNQKTRDIIKETLKELDSLCNLLDIKEKNSKLGIFMNGLDEKSKEIVWYMLRNGHANIRELAELINADTDNEVLVCVREVINQKSKEIFGSELMKFEENKIDNLTGEKILFSWWLSDEVPKLHELEGREELLDVFDEKEHIKVIAELPKLKEEEIEIGLKRNMLTISANGYQKNIPLFYSVRRISEKTYRNGILELKLEKLFR
ncbi:MAG: Hsp20/alpha crystallin family protein [Candidatus Thermoplasmatota archaeon]